MPAPLEVSVPSISVESKSRNPWKAICAASIGNALEFYDLLIYGYFALVIGKLFFPVDDELSALLLSTATFGIAFITRPLGAIILGTCADRVGRKASLTLSIAIMMAGTAIMTFVPTYEQIGIASTALVVIARMLQGFSAGGEFGAATAFMAESVDAKRRGFFASWQMSTQGLATVLAAGMSAFLSFVLTDSQLHEWGWRIAFGVGLLIGPVGIYIRNQIDETPEFKTMAATKQPLQNSPLRTIFKLDQTNLLLATGVVAATTAFNYMHKVYMPTYAMTQLHISATSSFLGAVITGTVLMLVAPLIGMLSDRFGRYKIILLALVLIMSTTLPLFLVLTAWPTATTLFFVQALVGLIIAASLGALPALLSEIFATNIRGTGLALSYNFSATLFGGFAPLIVTWLIAFTGSNLSPSFYVMSTALISILSALILASRMKKAGSALRTRRVE